MDKAKLINFRRHFSHAVLFHCEVGILVSAQSQVVLISDLDTRLSQVGLELTMKLMLVSNLKLALLLPQPPSLGVTLFCFNVFITFHYMNCDVYDILYGRYVYLTWCLSTFAFDCVRSEFLAFSLIL